jgi:crotonobetainyl-CoA:carnitine CoA-transferase CaiB-like acyl-CoA transferase
LDLTDEKRVHCGKILAALGVQTIKVEPPGGDPARNIHPSAVTDINKSLNWLAYNTNKRSATLNLETERAGKSSKPGSRSDFVLESFTDFWILWAWL